MSLASDMLKRLFQYCQITRSRHVLDDDPAKAKERLAHIDPPAATFFSGVLASMTVKPRPVKGVWLPEALSSTSPDLQNEKVIIHFPGGAFVITFGHEGSGRLVSGVLNKHLGASKLLWAQYRLAADEETCFPAAFQDALTYYNYVISLGINPKSIILSGDSAGGNVVLGLIRYLESTQQSGNRGTNGSSSRTNASALPLPGGAIVFSPWVEVTPNAGEVYSASPNAKSDILDPKFLQWGAESYLGKSGTQGEAAPYTSPLNHPFKTSVPLYIHVGAAEAFCQSVTSFARGMQEIGDNRVGFCATPKAPHDLLLTHPLFGMEGELRAAVDEALKLFDGGK